MDQLAAMRVFVAVGETQGFAAAGRRLRLSAPSVTRAIAGLEDHLGARLFHRTTRTVRLTEAGARYLADCRRLLGELDDADASAAGAHAEPRGLLGLTAPIQFGRLHVTPVVLAFLARHPAISVRTVFADRVVDLLDEGLDLAVRIGELPDSSLTAVRVGEVRRVVCAAPRYLRRRGTPRRPADLADHDAITFSAVTATSTWTFGGGQVVQPHNRLYINTADVAVAAAVAGHGITRLLSYQVADAVAAGQLTVVLEEHEPPVVPIHVVHREGRRTSARVRAFVDFAVPRLRARRPGRLA
jgi:DNA-binding transcriptional LysR family regulator